MQFTNNLVFLNLDLLGEPFILMRHCTGRIEEVYTVQCTISDLGLKF